LPTWWPGVRERLLTRHFLQRFLENDLVSPDSDRHDVISLLFAGLLSCTMFITVGLALKFVFMTLQTPGRTAALAVDDRLLFLTCSMIVMALVAVCSWEALSLDPRDSSILGPLPIAHGAIVRAKLRAVALFAAGFALAAIAMPTLLHPSLMVARLPIGLFAGLLLIVIHFGVSLTAGLFGFAAILAVRETLRACTGRHFARVGAIAQAVLIVTLVTSFLLVPAIVGNAARRVVSPASKVTLLPPYWFLGAQETLAGGLVDRLPRPDMPRRLGQLEQQATADYRAAMPAFRTLAVRSLMAFVSALALALGAYTWNSRRLPFPPVATRADRYVGPGVLARLVSVTIARGPATRAGFFFTVQCLLRSAPHRLVLAACTAVALALATVTFQDALGDQLDPRAPKTTGFVTQTLILAILLAGLGHVMRIPADLRANRLFHLAWLGPKERYVDGVNRAATTILIVPALLALFPTHILLFGLPLAAAHMLTGLLLGLVVLEAFAAGRRPLPFANSYHPPPDLNTKGPVVGIAALFGISMFASLERFALSGRPSALAFWLSLAALFGVLRYRRGRRERDVAEDAPDFYPSEMATLDLTSVS
jgi:hypothetical protein